MDLTGSSIFLRTAGLLLLSNVFITFAWYAHLRDLAHRLWYIAALVSWGIALFEYLLQVSGEPDRLHRVFPGAAQGPAGGHHAGGVRSLRGCVYATGASARLPLGRTLSHWRRVLHIPRPPRRLTMSPLLAAAFGLLITVPCLAQNRRERARDLRIPLDGTPGVLNAITDVPGVEVGHATLIRGSGKLRVGVGPIRTGVTAIFPRGTRDLSHVFAAWFSLNGNGEMTGTAWLDDYALLLYPITITNTNSVGIVRDAVIEWGRTRVPGVFNCCLPVVAETWDGDLNDIYGFHVGKAHVFQAFAGAKPGRVPEGNVGGGTGMQCLGFKGGIGTASRRLSIGAGEFTLGVLVQCNFGLRRQLRIAGVPVGSEITDPKPCYATRGPLTPEQQSMRCPAGEDKRQEQGSIITIIGTDAPLQPHQPASCSTRRAWCRTNGRHCRRR